jgi:6-phosphofructokinase 1
MGGVNLDFTIEKLGTCSVPSPMTKVRYVSDDDNVLFHSDLRDIQTYFDRGEKPPVIEVAGPREMICFEPEHLKCGIVTCGGLCPGLNDVIRAVVFSLHYHYGVNTVYGFRFGFEGLVEGIAEPPILLTPQMVERIHEMGGTILGTSRGPQKVADMVDTLERLGIGIFFAIGGDGTLRGARSITEEISRRGLKISVIGIPKTIDNDISFVTKSFGFETAVSEARNATYAAHSEAVCAKNGIGLVKLMGRESGFIASYAVLADSQVNFCLIPEVPFTLEKFLAALHERLARRGHAVILTAEGAGQELMQLTGERDASGNLRFGDIGIFLKEQILAYFKKAGIEVNLKYIDPSYMIRSVPAIPHDSAFCLLLGQNAVHAGMAGRTNMVVSVWNDSFTHIPINMAVSQRQKVDTEGWFWRSVVSATGQPKEML